MEYELDCDNVVPGCDVTVAGETKGDVAEAAAQHASQVHGMAELPDELTRRVLYSIRPAD